MVCGADVEETLSLLCSGAKVLRGEDSSIITRAEIAGQLLQAELLRHNKFVGESKHKEIVKYINNIFYSFKSVLGHYDKH